MVDSLEKYRVIIGYSEYLSYGLVKELIHRIGEKEGKSFEEVLKEIGVNRETIREPWGKMRVLEKAFEVLDPNDVLLEVFYDIRGVYQRVIRDILEIADEEVRKEVLMKCSFF